jgi:mannose-6-phosphate isomerase-like protein (cupin superfamily)
MKKNKLSFLFLLLLISCSKENLKKEKNYGFPIKLSPNILKNINHNQKLVSGKDFDIYAKIFNQPTHLKKCKNKDIIIYAASGKGEIQTGVEYYKLRAGDIIYIPKNIPFKIIPHQKLVLLFIAKKKEKNLFENVDNEKLYPVKIKLK